MIVAVSLLPNGEDALLKYSAFFYFAGSVKVIYILLSTFVGSILQGSGNAQEYILAQALGIYLPLLSLGIAGGSAISLFNSMSGGAMSVISSINLKNAFNILSPRP